MFESVTSSPRFFAASITASKKRSMPSSCSANIRAVAAQEIATEGMLSISGASMAGSASAADGLAAVAAPGVEVAQGRRHHRAADVADERVLVDAQPIRSRETSNTSESKPAELISSASSISRSSGSSPSSRSIASLEDASPPRGRG